MAKVKINCLNCTKEHFVEQKEINRGFGKFCSRKCKGEYHTKITEPLPSNVSCAYCGKPFYMSKSKQKLSKSGFYFCCRKHKDAAQRIGGIEEIMPSHYGTVSPDHHDHYRRKAFSKKEIKCERCGFDENPLGIIVHHKDRNRMNDDDDNLEVICGTCHLIEHRTKKSNIETLFSE